MLSSERLIAAVRRREPLWRFSCKDYRDLDKVYALWNEVAEEMDAPKADVKAKWRLLRTAYLRERENLNNGIPSAWSLMPEMEFLEGNIYENVSFLNKSRNGEARWSAEGGSGNANRLFLIKLHKSMKNVPDGNKLALRMKIMQFLEKNL